jgi:anion-transporting  ArsA/GET3 family ATPase
MHAGFRDRAKRVEDQLRSSRSSFALVASPNAETIDEAIFFYRKLQAAAMPFGGFLVNRVQDSAITTPEEAEEWRELRRDPAAFAGPPDLAARLIETFADYEARAAAHAANIEVLRERCPGPHFWHTVPAFDTDVHDLSGLARVNSRLFDR